MSTMTPEQARDLLASYMDDRGCHIEAENVRKGIDLESYENELKLVGWMYRHPRLAQPAQAVDVCDLCHELYAMAQGQQPISDAVTAMELRLTRALSGEKAGPVDGWKLVPVEPTQEMIDRGTDEHECEQGDSYYRAPSLSDTDAIAIYKAMLSASPAPDKED